MSIKLIKGSHEYKDLIVDMLDEWSTYNATHNDNTSPWCIFKNSYKDFDYYLNNLEVKDDSNSLVPDTVFFGLDEDRNIMIGAVNIRHYLNDYLLKYGGHIGYGVRPSERRKGYATELLKLSLVECKKLGIDKVLVIANKGNIGSVKTIINNGGLLENEVADTDGVIKQRYWIIIK